MKQIDMMWEGENLSWCYPITDGCGNWAVICDDQIVSLCNQDGEPVEVTEKDIRKLAMDVCPDYETESEESTDEEIIMRKMTETGCTDCPWRDICDAMNEEIEDDDTDE